MISSKTEYMERVCCAAEYIKNSLKNESIDIPSVCIVLGSGLAPLASMCEVLTEIPYKNIPCFPESTAPGHEGRLIVGKLSEKNVFMMSGRFHYYEGYDYDICTFYVRVMSYLKVNSLILTNAAGGLGEGMKPTDLMLIEDHVSFLCESPLRGQNLDDFGVRFPDQTCVYDKELASLLLKSAEELGITLHRGVYCYTKGPQYETPTEIKILKMLGVGAVGMSTVPEAIVASHCQMRVAAVSCITNLAAGISPVKLTQEEVIENAGKASENSCNLVKKLVEKI